MLTKMTYRINLKGVEHIKTVDKKWLNKGP